MIDVILDDILEAHRLKQMDKFDGEENFVDMFY